MNGEQLFDLWVLHVREPRSTGPKLWHELTPKEKDRWNALAVEVLSNFDYCECE